MDRTADGRDAVVDAQKEAFTACPVVHVLAALPVVYC